MEIFNKYIEDVLSGKVLCSSWVKLAVQRHLNDMKAGFWQFDWSKAQKAIKFIELMPHTKGRWASQGMKLVLEPWQIFIIASIFGWIDPVSGNRRFNEAWAYEPRKNGKSAKAGAIGLYMLTADGEHGAEVYAGATSLKQALAVFEPAWLMAKKTEALVEYFELQFSGVPKNPTGIFSSQTGSKFIPIIGNPPDGQSPHCAIIDEFHEHPDFRMFDTMETGMGARLQPILFGITTAGFTLSSPAYTKQLQIQDILQGNIDQPRTFGIIHCADIGDDWKDLETAKKANPNFGVSISEDFIENQLSKALQSVGSQNTYKTKHLNQWVDVKEAFLDVQKWRDCATFNFDKSVFEDGCVIGMDLASKNDVASWGALTEKNNQIFYKAHHYLPEGVLTRIPEHLASRYRQWHQQGFLKLVPGDVLNYGIIEADILEFAEQNQIDQIGFDPWNASYLTSRLQEHGLPMISFGNQVKTMSEPMKELEAVVLSKKLVHDNNPMTNWMAGNIRGKRDKKGNVFPEKSSKNEKIDGIVALIMALGLMMNGYSSKQETISEILFL